MKIFTPEEIAIAHEFSKEVAELNRLRDAPERTLGRSAIEEKIALASRAAPAVTLARDILEAKIDATVAAYLEATARFYEDESRALRVAQSSGLVTKLRHEQSELSSSPSLQLAEALREIFEEFIAANPLPKSQQTATLSRTQTTQN